MSQKILFSFKKVEKRTILAGQEEARCGATGANLDGENCLNEALIETKYRNSLTV